MRNKEYEYFRSSPISNPCISSSYKPFLPYPSANDLQVLLRNRPGRCKRKSTSSPFTIDDIPQNRDPFTPLNTCTLVKKYKSRAAPTTVLPLRGVTGAPPTLAPRRRTVQLLSTPSGGASGSRLTRIHSVKLMNSPVGMFGSSCYRCVG